MRSMEDTHVQSRGFTLMESMIALLILTIGLLGLAHLFVLAINQSAYARQNTMAVSVAEDKLEELKNMYSNDQSTGGTSADLVTGSHGPVTVSILGTSGSNQGTYQYSVSWTVSNPSGKEKDITVTVTAVKTNVKQNRTVQLSTHLAP